MSVWLRNSKTGNPKSFFLIGFALRSSSSHTLLNIYRTPTPTPSLRSEFEISESPVHFPVTVLPIRCIGIRSQTALCGFFHWVIFFGKLVQHSRLVSGESSNQKGLLGFFSKHENASYRTNGGQIKRIVKLYYCLLAN
jgi:hypothetical protein